MNSFKPGDIVTIKPGIKNYDNGGYVVQSLDDIDGVSFLDVHAIESGMGSRYIQECKLTKVGELEEFNDGDWVYYKWPHKDFHNAPRGLDGIRPTQKLRVQEVRALSVVLYLNSGKRVRVAKTALLHVTKKSLPSWW